MEVIKNRSLFRGIALMRCPKCRQGKMFPEGTLYSTRFMQINSRCSCCDQSFMPEPGYYFGAMFVSYGLNAAYFVAVWIAMYLLLDRMSVSLMVGAIVALIIGLLPVTFRLSRVLWIYMFVKHDKAIACGRRSIVTDHV